MAFICKVPQQVWLAIYVAVLATKSCNGIKNSLYEEEKDWTI